MSSTAHTCCIFAEDGALGAYIYEVRPERSLCTFKRHNKYAALWQHSLAQTHPVSLTRQRERDRVTAESKADEAI